MNSCVCERARVSAALEKCKTNSQIDSSEWINRFFGHWIIAFHMVSNFRFTLLDASIDRLCLNRYLYHSSLNSSLNKYK